jgi:hypothetical protein
MSVVHSRLASAGPEGPRERSGQMAIGSPAGNCEQREILSEALCT